MSWYGSDSFLENIKHWKDSISPSPTTVEEQQSECCDVHMSVRNEVDPAIKSLFLNLKNPKFSIANVSEIEPPSAIFNSDSISDQLGI